MEAYHIPVLLDESIDGLDLKEDGVYVDTTFGGGGHSREILKRLKGGKLLAFDQDEDAAKNTWDDDRLLFIQQNFRYLKKYLRLHRIEAVDGILCDLGVSSHQIDTPDRGFSTRFDGDLDMRMNQSAIESAKDLVNRASVEELQRMFGEYGEVRNARTLAMAVVKSRPLNTLAEFKAICKPLSKGKENKYLARAYQALRIAVNDEIGALRELLEDSLEVLKPGGRLVVISYHSLEDRLVKNLMKRGNLRGEVEKDFYGNPHLPFKELSKKPIAASDTELTKNPRARSARLRIAERLP